MLEVIKRADRYTIINQPVENQKNGDQKLTKTLQNQPIHLFNQKE